MVFKKCREKDDTILFIDASGDDHFAKEGNQNVLRHQDVEKIIATYRNRTAIEKYSYVATLDELKENDYNLNIPRYVDTFEEEEAIDLDLVATELVQIATDLKTNENIIATYCNQLNIKTPF